LLAYNQIVKHDFHDWDVDSPALNTIYVGAADNGNVLWKLATEQSMGGGIVSYSAGGRQLSAWPRG
jgi:hypothetical protein